MASSQRSYFVPAMPMALACALLACRGPELRLKTATAAPAPTPVGSTPAPTPAPASPAQAFAPNDPRYGFADPDRKRKLKGGFAALDAIAADELAAQKLPGLALGVVIDGELAYEKGFGFADLEKKTKPDADTIFRIGSITKSVTGLAILSLRDDGALALDDPLTRLVPETAGLVYPTTDAAPITLRQLLTHKSGLPGQGAFGPDGPTEATILASLASFPLDNAPGTTYQYSNLGFSLLGIAAARAGRAPFREIVSARILRPLGMISTVWDRASTRAMAPRGTS
jgi:CubicO group peptidase (beta-lactamase class C family)